MSEDQDQRIADLLRAVAPPARDPVFRLKVLEQRERREFRRRSFIMLAGALLIMLFSILAIGFGRAAQGTTGTLVTGAALATAWFAFRGRLLRVLRRFSL